MIVQGLPHTRGGVSLPSEDRIGQVESSPHTWGCFFSAKVMSLGRGVFPTHVGVFLDLIKRPEAVTRLPHTRGGVSAVPDDVVATLRSSPHTWGCF